MLINYNLPTYDEDSMEEYTKVCSKNIIKHNRELIKLYGEINAGEVKPKNIDTIINYGVEEGDYDPYNFTYFAACYFAKELKEKFDISYETSLNYTRLFAEGLYYFVLYDEDKETYDYLMKNLSFNSGYTNKAKELLDVYLRKE